MTIYRREKHTHTQTFTPKQQKRNVNPLTLIIDDLILRQWCMNFCQNERIGHQITMTNQSIDNFDNLCPLHVPPLIDQSFRINSKYSHKIKIFHNFFFWNIFNWIMQIEFHQRAKWRTWILNHLNKIKRNGTAYSKFMPCIIFHHTI